MLPVPKSQRQGEAGLRLDETLLPAPPRQPSQPLFNEAGVFSLTTFFFGAVAVVLLLALGATIVSIFGTVKDKASRRAERVLGVALLLCLTTGFMGLLVVVLVLVVVIL